MIYGKVAMLEWGRVHCWWLQVLLLFSFFYSLACIQVPYITAFPRSFLIPWNPLHSELLPRVLALILQLVSALECDHRFWSKMKAISFSSSLSVPSYSSVSSLTSSSSLWCGELSKSFHVDTLICLKLPNFFDKTPFSVSQTMVQFLYFFYLRTRLANQNSPAVILY